jgi:PilZ domain
VILAEVTLDGDLSTCAWQALLFLLLLGGVLFCLCYLVGERNPVASGTTRAERLARRLGSLNAAIPAKTPAAPEPSAAANRSHNRRGPKEFRSSLRRRGKVVPVLVSDVEASMEPIQGLVLNRSRGGLCLSVPQPVEVGRLLAVRTADFPEDLDSVQIRVRHCKRKGDSCHLGCQFVESHPWSVLLIFG